MLVKLIAVAILFPAVLFGATAQEIIDHVVRTYSGCDSYEDQGQATTEYYGLRETAVKLFSTAFLRREARFRYEFKAQHRGQEEWSRYLIWMDGHRISTWWTVQPQVAHPESFGLAVAGATGVSDSSAFTVPSLLLTALTGHNVFDTVTDFRTGKAEPVDGVNCVTVGARGKVGSRQYTYWIGEADLLIRKIESTDAPSAERRARAVLSYSPKINGAIEDSQLVFDPAAAR